jgi:hypothetical protein
MTLRSRGHRGRSRRPATEFRAVKFRAWTNGSLRSLRPAAANCKRSTTPYLAMGFALALALVGCSSSGKLSQVPASSVYLKCNIGKATTIAQSKPPPGFKIDVALTFAQHTPIASPAVGSPTAGNYEVAMVRISSSSGSFHYAASSFEFVTLGNQSYPPLAQNPDGTSGVPLGTGILSAGQTTSGTIAFDVPAGGGHIGFFDGSGLQLCGWPVAS